MKIVYVVHDMSAGGVATIVNNLMHGMSNKDYEIHIIILKDVFPEAEIFCDNISVLNISNKADYLRGALKLSRIINKINPDIIHSHTVLSHILVLLTKFCYNSNVKIVCTEHSSLTINQNKSFIFNIFSWLSKKPDKITFVSEFSLNSYLEKGIVSSKSNTVVIYNGVKEKKVDFDNLLKTKKELGFSENFKTFCFIGRLSPEKNIEMMLKAFSLVEYNNIKLIIVGDGSVEYRNRLMALSNELNLNNVLFLGYRSDIADIMNLVDCLLLSSFVEGLPTVVIEAYSQKKIAISTICGGVEEVIKDKRFLSANNDEYDFSSKIKFYLSLNNEEKDVISSYNYSIFENNFHINFMVDNFYRLYQGIVDD